LARQGEAEAASARAAWQGADERSLSRKLENRRFRSRARRWGLTTLLLAGVGWAVWLIYQSHPPTPLIAVAETDYEAPLPPNAWAREDVGWFEAAAKAPRANLAWQKAPSPASNRDQWLTVLSDRVQAATTGHRGILPGLRPLPVVLVYVSAHGVVDPKGRACLILPAADDGGPEPRHLAPERWLPVSELVTRLDEVASGWKKVLLLDATRLPSHWGLGLLDNDFADQLPKALGDARSVVIVNSTSAGEIGWTSPKVGGSIFARAVLHGLRGAATRPGRDRVTLNGLVEYLQVRVDEWSRRHRGCSQRPMRVAAMDEANAKNDFDLVYAKPSDGDEGWDDLGAELAPGIAAYREALRGKMRQAQDLWKLLDDRARRASAGGESPAGFLRAEQLRQELLRWEQLAWAGPFYLNQADKQWPDLEERIRKFQQPQALSGACSLWRACPWRRADRSPPDAAAAWVQHENAPKTLSESARMLKVWESLRDAPPGELWQSMRNQLDDLGTGDSPEPIEIRWLRLLAADGSLPPPTSGDALAEALNQRNLAEQAAWPADDRAHHAVRALVEQADEIRRRADDGLFLGDRDHASDHYAKAAGLYTEAQTLGEDLRAAFRVRDRAYAELPYRAQWLDWRFRFRAESAADDAGYRRQLLDAIGVLHRLTAELDTFLAAVLARRADGESAIPSNEFERLRKQLENMLNSLAVVDKPKAMTAADLTGLLSIASRLGADRADLWESLADRCEKEDLPGGPLTPKDRQDKERGAKLAPVWAWDVHPALALLDLKTPPRKERKQATPPDDEETAEREDELRKEGKRVRKKLWDLRKAPAPEALAEADKALPALEQIGKLRSKLSEPESRRRAAVSLLAAEAKAFEALRPPFERLVEFDLRHFLVWQAHRAVSDFWGEQAYPAPDANYYQQLARRLLHGVPPHAPEGWPARDLLEQELTRAEQFKISLEANAEGGEAPNAVMRLSCSLGPGGGPGEAALFVVDKGHERRFISAEGSKDKSRLPVKVAAADDGAGAASTPLTNFDGPVRFADDTSANPASCSLVALYRGHRHAEPIGAGGGAYRSVRYDRPKDRAVTVKVTHDRLAPTSILFLLDCSGSMTLKAENENGTRMEAAKAALKGVLRTLGGQRRVRARGFGCLAPDTIRARATE